MFGTAFLKDALERALKTLAQTVLAAIGLDAANVINADWGQVLSLGAGATIISVLTSVVSAPRDDTISPASAVKVDDAA